MCCMHMAQPPFCGPEDPDWQALPQELKDELEAIGRNRDLQFKATGSDLVPCAWLDMATAKCRRYDHRPTICREHDMGGEDCRRQRRAAGLPA